MQNTDMEKISENIKPQPQKVFDYYSGKLDPEEGKKIEEQLSEENAALLVSVKKLLDLDKQMTELYCPVYIPIGVLIYSRHLVVWRRLLFFRSSV